MNPQFLISFVGRLQARDPSAIALLRKLAHLHHHGDPKATNALHKIAAIHRSPAMMAGAMTASGHADGMGFAMPHVLHGLMSTVGKIFGTAGNLLEGTGRLAAKPFHFAQNKLGAQGQAIHFLPAHH